MGMLKKKRRDICSAVISKKLIMQRHRGKSRGFSFSGRVEEKGGAVLSRDISKKKSSKSSSGAGGSVHSKGKGKARGLEKGECD